MAFPQRLFNRLTAGADRLACPEDEEPMIPFPQISPEIFTIQLFGMELALRWYALAYLVGLLIG